MKLIQSIQIELIRSYRKTLFQSSKPSILTVIGFVGLTGCATERLRENTLEAGATTTDIVYEMALSNIAMVRYYKGADILPWDFQVSGGVVAVNDMVGLTAGAALGGAHGIVIPSVSIPTTRTLQQQWSVVPTNNIALLTILQPLYKQEAKNSVYHDGIPPLGSLSGTYRDRQVWIDSKDVSELTHFVGVILGSKAPPKSSANSIKTQADIQELRKADKAPLSTPISSPTYNINR